MDDDWQVLRYHGPSSMLLRRHSEEEYSGQATIVVIFNRESGLVVRVALGEAGWGGDGESFINVEDYPPRLRGQLPCYVAPGEPRCEFGLNFVGVDSFEHSYGDYSYSSHHGFTDRYDPGGQASEYVRRVVECRIDEVGWHIGEVDNEPDCSQIGNDWIDEQRGDDTDEGDSGDGDGGDNGGGDDGTACSVGLVLSPGDYCTFGENRFRVTSDGQGCYEGPGILLCSGNGIALSGFEANRVSGTNDWRIDVLP